MAVKNKTGKSEKKLSSVKFWVQIFQGCLSMFKRYLPKFLPQYMTVDKAAIHYYTPKSKKWKTAVENETGRAEKNFLS